METPLRNKSLVDYLFSGLQPLLLPIRLPTDYIYALCLNYSANLSDQTTVCIVESMHPESVKCTQFSDFQKFA